jgi:hypothetical protein
MTLCWFTSLVQKACFAVGRLVTLCRGCTGAGAGCLARFSVDGQQHGLNANPPFQDTIRVNFLSVCMAPSESSLVTARLLTIRLQDSAGPPCRTGHIPFQLPTSHFLGILGKKTCKRSIISVKWQGLSYRAR